MMRGMPATGAGTNRAVAHRTAAILLAAALLTVALVACSSATATTGLGQVPGSPGVAPPPAGSSGPTGTPTGLGTATGTSTRTHAASPSASSVSPSYRRLGGDYAITMPTGLCYEVRLNDGGNYLLAIGADFLITYHGLYHPATVPFQLTNDAQVGMRSGNMAIGQQFASYFGTYAADAGNPYLGKTVKITATIMPPGTDNNDITDDSVSANVSVPTTLPTDTNAHEVGCSPA
jgi:hypothetical protein